MSNSTHIMAEELELLALGALPEPDAAAMQPHLSDCAGCAGELAEARGTAALLGLAVRQERAAGTVKAELLARIRANRESEQRNAWPQRAPHVPEARGAARRTGSSWWTWALTAAAVVLALVSAGLSWQNRRIASELEKQRQAAERLIRDRQAIEKFVNVLAGPDTVTVKLSGTSEAPSASGVVKFNAKAGVVLYAADLPRLPADKSYQMWLVPMDASPISAGVLGPGGHAWGNMWTGEVPAGTRAKTFTVTVEPVGGVAQPTGPKVLLGVV